MTGASWERKLIEVLGEHGWEAMRAPASGSATVRELPDVLAGRPADEIPWVPDDLRGLPRWFSGVLAIEVKYRSESPAYFDREELEALIEFSNRFGARPLVAARWNGNEFPSTDFFLASAQGVAVTETKAKLEYRECEKHWMTIDQLTERTQS